MYLFSNVLGVLLFLNLGSNILIWKDIHTPIFITELFTIAKTGVHQQMNGYGGCSMCVCVCVCNRILLSHKKEWNLAIWDNMDGPKGYYAKWNKKDKEKYGTVSLI